jgi:hypothetical protein
MSKCSPGEARGATLRKFHFPAALLMRELSNPIGESTRLIIKQKHLYPSNATQVEEVQEVDHEKNQIKKSNWVETRFYQHICHNKKISFGCHSAFAGATASNFN